MGIVRKNKIASEFGQISSQAAKGLNEIFQHPEKISIAVDLGPHPKSLIGKSVEVSLDDVAKEVSQEDYLKNDPMGSVVASEQFVLGKESSVKQARFYGMIEIATNATIVARRQAGLETEGDVTWDNTAKTIVFYDGQPVAISEDTLIGTKDGLVSTNLEAIASDLPIEKEEEFEISEPSGLGNVEINLE